MRPSRRGRMMMEKSKTAPYLEVLLPFCRVLQSLPGTLELGYHLKQTKYGKYFSLSMYNL